MPETQLPSASTTQKYVVSPAAIGTLRSTVLALVLNLQPYNGGYNQSYYNRGY